MLRTEAGLGPHGTVLDWEPAPPQKWAQQLPHFSAHFALVNWYGRPSQQQGRVKQAKSVQPCKSDNVSTTDDVTWVRSITRVTDGG